MATQPISIRVAQAIRSMLEDKHLTQEWLVEATGIPMRTLARRLHLVNPSSLSIEELDAIAAALDVSMVELLAQRSEREMVVAS